MMQHSYPQQGSTPSRAEQTAISFMRAGAALSAVGIVADLATVGRFRAAVLASYPNYSSGAIHRLELVTLGGAVVAGVLAIGLWIWMARASKSRRPWVRGVGTALFGLNTLALLSTLVRPHTGWELVGGSLVWLAGLGAVACLRLQRSGQRDTHGRRAR
jgi:hypothetical protein